MHIGALLAAAITIAATTSASAAEPAFVGTWSADAAKCGVPQSMPDAPMILRADGYDRHETHCTFTLVKKTKAGWRVGARCSVEGDAAATTFGLAVKGGKLVMQEGRGRQTFVRCR